MWAAAPFFFSLLAALPALARGEVHPGHAPVQRTLLERRAGRLTSHRRHEVRKPRPNGGGAVAFAVDASGGVTQVRATGSGVRKVHSDSEGPLVPMKALAPNKGGETGITRLWDMSSEFIGKIGVGTGADGKPLFEAEVVFDTGSSNLWVGSSLCEEFPCSAEQTRAYYNPTRSTTFQPFDMTKASGGDEPYLTVTFGTGSMTGALARDTVQVGSVTVQNATIAMVSKMSGHVFESWPFQGIMGLAFQKLANSNEKYIMNTYLDDMINQKALVANEFAFYMNQDRSLPSAILWGGVDPDLYHGPIHMFPVTDEFYWGLELVDFKIGDESMKDHHFAGTGVRTFKIPELLVVDTGTTFFTVPSAMNGWVKDKMPSKSCGEVTNYPNMTFVLKDVHRVLHEIRVSQETYMVQDDGEQASDDENCSPAVMPLDLAPPSGIVPIIIGEVFMRHFFTVFTRGDGSEGSARVGLAPAKLGASPFSSAPASAAMLAASAPANIVPGRASGDVIPLKRQVVGPATLRSSGSHEDLMKLSWGPAAI